MCSKSPNKDSRPLFFFFFCRGNLLCEAPSGPFRQKVPVPVSSPIRRYRTGDFDSLAEVLRACYEEKAARTRLVADRTWDRWAEDHHQLFQRLLKERGISMPEPAPGFRFGMMAELDIPPKLDVRNLEVTLDSTARHLYFGRYREARAEIEGVVSEYPFAGKLL